MRHLLNALVLSLLAAGGLAAQSASISIRPGVGVFTPLTPLVEVDDGENANVELEGAAASGIEVTYSATPAVEVYGGGSAVFSRLAHSGVLDLRDVDRTASSRVALFIPTGGVVYRFGGDDSPVRPTVRAGAGAKIYDFDLYDVQSLVVDITGDVGLGISAAADAVSVSAEARWLPGRFNANSLPIRTVGQGLQTRIQNDWIFQLGLAFRP